MLRYKLKTKVLHGPVLKFFFFFFGGGGGGGEGLGEGFVAHRFGHKRLQCRINKYIVSVYDEFVCFGAFQKLQLGIGPRKAFVCKFIYYGQTPITYDA